MSLPSGAVKPEQYIRERVDEQHDWYQKKANRFERQWVQFGTCIALTTGLASLMNWVDATAGGTAKYHNYIVASTAFLMAVATAITGLATLTSAEYNASAYRATARQLRRLKRDWLRGKKYAGTDGYSQFVADVERVLTAEHASWRRQALKDAAAPLPAQPALPPRAAPPVEPPPPAPAEGETVAPAPAKAPATAAPKEPAPAGAPPAPVPVPPTEQQLTPHFTLAELTRSSAASAKNIDNHPPPEIIEHLRITAAGMERIRDLLGHPITVTSGYRSEALNHEVGGSPTSDHRHGWCVDFVCPRFGTPYAVARAIRESPIFDDVDQLIHEFGSWVHVSFRPSPRRRAFTLCKVPGAPARKVDEIVPLDAEGRLPGPVTDG